METFDAMDLAIWAAYSPAVLLSFIVIADLISQGAAGIAHAVRMRRTARGRALHARHIMQH